VNPGQSGVAVTGRSPLAADRVAALVGAVLQRERRAAFVSVAFVGRERMRALHHRFKRRPGVTDVIAFALPGPGGTLAGDVYICPWAATRAARRLRIPLRQELIRLLIHGTLHVLGYAHPEDETRTASPMWRRQERYLAALT
jgi:probable rRNA maturation factor